MKKSFSIVYTVLVILILLGVLIYFGSNTMKARSARIADFETRAQEYSRRMANTLVEHRDVNKEVQLAESLMESDPALMALQVYSHGEGLRLSVVKQPAERFSRKAITESEVMEGFLAPLRYHTVRKPMAVKDMNGLETVFIAATLTGAEIRNNLLVLLITVVGLFIITIVIMASSGRANTVEPSEEKADETESDPGEISEDGTEFNLPPLPDDLDLPESMSDSLDMDGDMDFEPDFDEPNEPSEDFRNEDSDPEFMKRLGKELERAASFNQDLTLLLIKPGVNTEDRIRESFEYEDLIFNLNNGQLAVIEVNKDLDTVMAKTEDIIRSTMTIEANRETRAGIASRNGRLMEPQRIMKEASAALGKTTQDTNIVAFRSNPEQYREYLEKNKA